MILRDIIKLETEGGWKKLKNTPGEARLSRLVVVEGWCEGIER